MTGRPPDVMLACGTWYNIYTCVFTYAMHFHLHFQSVPDPTHHIRMLTILILNKSSQECSVVEEGGVRSCVWSVVTCSSVFIAELGLQALCNYVLIGRGFPGDWQLREASGSIEQRRHTGRPVQQSTHTYSSIYMLQIWTFILNPHTVIPPYQCQHSPILIPTYRETFAKSATAVPWHVRRATT